MADRILLKFSAMRGELLLYPFKSLARVLQYIKTPIFYRANPSLGFSPREVQDLQVTQLQNQPVVDVTLNFMGLQGASTPLPVHFSEAIVQDDPDDSNLNEFYNFFNQRLYSILVAIDQKYAYLPQVASDHNDALSRKMTRFAGFIDTKPGKTQTQLYPFLHSLLGTNLAKGNWCRMLAGVIGAEKAWVIERVPIRIPIPNHALGKLGHQSTLAHNLSLGGYVTQAKNHLELHLDINEQAPFLPHQPVFQNLKALVMQTLRENVFVHVVLHAKQAATLALSHSHPVGLGYSSMLGHERVEAYAVRFQLV